MTSEAWVYRNRVGPGLSGHGHVCRVENSVESGTPDVSYAIDGVQGWVELKVVRDGLMKFEKFQLNWAKIRLRSAPRLGVWVLAVDEDLSLLRLWPTASVLAAPRSQVRKWVAVRASDVEPYHQCTRPFRWAEVARLLAGGEPRGCLGR